MFLSRTLLSLIAFFFVNVSIAAPDPQCGEYDKLRAQRDHALGTKNFKQYCDALSGLIKLMPAATPVHARLQCEAKATNMKVETWLGVRPSVISTMAETFASQCK